jgi:hypothetical protein
MMSITLICSHTDCHNKVLLTALDGTGGTDWPRQAIQPECRKWVSVIGSLVIHHQTGQAEKWELIIQGVCKLGLETILNCDRRFYCCVEHALESNKQFLKDCVEKS